MILLMSASGQGINIGVNDLPYAAAFLVGMFVGKWIWGRATR